MAGRHVVDAARGLQREFLVTPGTACHVRNTGSTPLLIYSVFPLVL